MAVDIIARKRIYDIETSGMITAHVDGAILSLDSQEGVTQKNYYVTLSADPMPENSYDLFKALIEAPVQNKIYTISLSSTTTPELENLVKLMTVQYISDDNTKISNGSGLKVNGSELKSIEITTSDISANTVGDIYLISEI